MKNEEAYNKVKHFSETFYAADDRIREAVEAMVRADGNDLDVVVVEMDDLECWQPAMGGTITKASVDFLRKHYDYDDVMLMIDKDFCRDNGLQFFAMLLLYKGVDHTTFNNYCVDYEAEDGLRKTNRKKDDSRDNNVFKTLVKFSYIGSSKYGGHLRADEGFGNKVLCYLESE